MPEPEDRGHLATVAVRHGPADAADATLFRAIDRRRTDRRRMSHRPVPDDHLRALAAQAQRTGTLLLPVTDPAMRLRLLATLTDASHLQEFAPGYAAELQQWTHRYDAGRDGVPATSVAQLPVGRTEASPLRQFSRGELDQPHQLPGHGPADDAAELLVIVTAHDDPLDWLRAGESTSAVLLAATGLGLATTPLSQALEVETSRRELQQEVLHVPEYPQLVVRVGWPATGATELLITARRELRSVLLPT
jgi:hypothetical protein